MCSRTAYQMIQTGRTRSHSRAIVAALADVAAPAEPFRRDTWNNFGGLRRRLDGSAHLRRQATVPVLKAAAKRLDLCPVLAAGRKPLRPYGRAPLPWTAADPPGGPASAARA